MVTLNGSTTHTVQFKEPPSRVLRFVVGVCLLYALWTVRDRVADLVFHALRADAAPESMGSVTGVLLPLVVEFIIALGGVGVFIGTFGWTVVVDIATGVFAWVRTWSARSNATAAATAAATVAAQEAASVQAGISATAAATATAATSATSAATGAAIGTDFRQFVTLVQQTLREQRDAIAELRTAIESKANEPAPVEPPTRRTRRGGA